MAVDRAAPVEGTVHASPERGPSPEFALPDVLAPEFPSTEFESAGARAEQAMLDVFLWMRLSHLGAGLVSLAFDRGRYRRPGLATATLAVVAAESLWLTRRCRRTQSYTDPTVTAVDTAVGCAGLVTCALALRRDQQFGSTNWMFPLTLFSVVGASAGFRSRRQSISAGIALMGTYAAVTTARAPGRTRESLFGTFQYAGCFVGGDLVIRRHRANASLIEQAGRDAVERARHVARARERARLGREVHAGALATLEQLRDLWPNDRDRARTLARREAIRLRREIRDDGGPGPLDLAHRLEEVARDLAASGMRCDLVFDELESAPAVETVAAVGDAVRAALQNIIDHAGVTSAVVRIAETDGMIEVTVRDRGRGSDRRAAPTSVARAMERVAGETEWWSAPGRGTRVGLRVPR